MDSTAHHVLMITPFHQAQRGNSITTARIREGLAARGYQIELLSLDEPGWTNRLQAILTGPGCDLLHGFNARHMGQLLHSHPALTQLPLIVTTTGTDIHVDLDHDYRTSVLRALAAARVIVVFHEDFRLRVFNAYPPARDKLVVIPQSVWLPDAPARNRCDFGLSPDETIFVLPSGLRPVKNISLAIDALLELHPGYPHMRLVIIGADLDSSYSRPLLERMHTLPWVTYWGEIPHQEMGARLAVCDVVLNTSRSEGQPQAALEAMSLGLPCIMTDVPGNRHLITNGREGFYVRDEMDLCRAARRLLDDQHLRQQMGARAQQLVRSKYHPQQEIDAYEQLYRQILQP